MDLKDLEKAYKAKQESAFREEAEMHKEALVKKEVIFMHLQKSILTHFLLGNLIKLNH